MKKRIIWQNFFKLMSILLLLVLFLLLFVYRSSLKTIQNEFCNFNEQKIHLVENNMESAVDQSRRIAAYLCTDTDSKLFFEAQNPQAVDEDIYSRISARLESYEYGIDYISSIILYSQKHMRLIDEDGIEQLKNGIISLEDKENFMMTRAENNSYPFVLTIVQSYRNTGVEGIAITNLDLKKLYNKIWTEDHNDTEVYVLDAEGRVIISKGKQKLYEDSKNIGSLSKFQLTEESFQSFFMDGKTAKTYGQQYNERLNMYFVSVSTLSDYNQRISEVQKEILFIFLVVMIGIGCLVFFYCRTSFSPLQNIMEILNDPKYWVVKNGEADTNVKEVSEQIVFHLQNNKELRKELEEHLELLKETQIQALQAQLNPHFLFNTLDAIGMMVEEDKEINRLVRSLTDILRYSISGNDLVTLEQESRYLEKYVYILQCRYGDSFEVNMQICDELKCILVPKLILQPLIENAVFHGIMAREEDEGGLLEVRGVCVQHTFEHEKEEMVMLEIRDNGHGIAEERLEQLRSSIKDMTHVETEHIGVQNVAKRLYLLFAERSVMEIESTQGLGTTIRLIFPKLENIKEEVQNEPF